MVVRYGMRGESDSAAPGLANARRLCPSDGPGLSILRRKIEHSA
jgi:hypothetical protein